MRNRERAGDLVRLGGRRRGPEGFGNNACPPPPENARLRLWTPTAVEGDGVGQQLPRLWLTQFDNAGEDLKI